MSILDDMAARLTIETSKEEGSFAMDNLAAVAAELERIEDMKLDYMPNRFFPTLASGDDLTLAAENFGITRKAATAATVTLTITGTQGTVIDDTVKAECGELIYACASATIPASGTVNVTATCETAGAAGNVAAGQITEFITAYEGLDSVTNTAAATGGTDEETDTDLLERVKARWQKPSTGGNIGDYETWALSVPGVSKVRVQNPSAGNVSLYIIATGNTVPDASLVSAAQVVIDANCPVGAAATVSAATRRPMTVTVTGSIMEGYTETQITAAITDELEAYFENISFKADIVSYLKLADLLFVEGVEDIQTYRLNGGVIGINLNDNEFPYLFALNWTEAT